jgi:hypothetical protein
MESSSRVEDLFDELMTEIKAAIAGTPVLELVEKLKGAGYDIIVKPEAIKAQQPPSEQSVRLESGPSEEEMGWLRSIGVAF